METLQYQLVKYLPQYLEIVFTTWDEFGITMPNDVRAICNHTRGLDLNSAPSANMAPITSNCPFDCLMLFL